MIEEDIAYFGDTIAVGIAQQRYVVAGLRRRAASRKG
jgi:hypothetical protein